MISVKEIEFKYGGEYTLKVDSRELDDGEKNTEYKYIKEFSLVVNSLKLESGKSLAITGVSGSGKSTLLKVLSAELTPTKGDISVLDQNLYKMKESERRNFRLKNFGMIFQDSPLLEYLTVSENILLPRKFLESRSRWRFNNSRKIVV